MAAKRPLPARLEKEPLLEAIWEIRFRPTQPAAAEILTGLMFANLGTQLGFDSVSPQPAASIPAALREMQEPLRYATVTHLRGKRFSMSVGPRTLSFSALKPYPGWDEFRKRIFEVVAIVEKSRIVGALERFSLKYVDVLTELRPLSLNALNLTIRVGDLTLREEPTQLQFERVSGKFVHVVQISTPVDFAMQHDQSKGRGLSVAVDTVVLVPENEPWSTFHSTHLNDAHLENKTVFFDILTAETETSLRPIYDK